MKKSISLILPNIRSCHNVGSIFRTADAFGVDKIYLCGYTPAPPDPRIDKVALGAEKTTAFEKQEDTASLIKNLQKKGVSVVAAELTDDSIDYANWKPDFPLAIVFGHEVDGVPEDILNLVDQKIHIPMLGSKESLNVSVAAGVILARLRMNK